MGAKAASFSKGWQVMGLLALTLIFPVWLASESSIQKAFFHKIAFLIGGPKELVPLSLKNPLTQVQHGNRASDQSDTPQNTPQDYSISRCDIDRKPWISMEEFTRDYFEKKPLILTNVTDSWRQKGAMFSKEVLREHYGDIVVKCGFSAQFPLAGGNGRSFLTIRDYIDYLDTPELREITATEPLYLFDRGDVAYHAASLMREAKVPDALYMFQTYENLDTFFGLGAALTGVQFHSHNDAYNTIIFGQKRWLLYPPNRMPPMDYMSHKPLTEWIDSVIPELPQEFQPMECVQEAGELIYVPEGWYHAVLNLKDTMAIAGQVLHAQTHFLTSTYYAERLRTQHWAEPEVKKENLEKSIKIYRSLVNLYDNCESCAVELIKALYEAERFEESLEEANKFVQLYPYNYLLYLSRAMCLKALGRLEEAFESMKISTELNPDNAFASKELSSLALDLGHTDMFAELSRRGDLREAAEANYMSNLDALQDQIRHKLAELRGELQEMPVDQKTHAETAVGIAAS